MDKQLGPITIHEDPPRKFGNGETDYGGYRLDAPDIEQVAYVWKKNKRFGSGEEFGADEALAYATLFKAAPDLLRELLAYRAIIEAIENHCKNEAGLRGLDHADEGRRIRHGLQLLLAQPSAAIAKATSAARSSSHGA